MSRADVRVGANPSAASVEIRRARTPQDVGEARALFEEYAAWLGVDLCFQGFAQELARLPGDYAPPRGRLLIAGPRGAPIGCVALRPCGIASDPAGTAGEVKRLYVRAGFQGAGVGRRLAEAIVAEARSIGYRRLQLDTLAQMAPARALYESLGFRDIPPYYRNPLPDVRYMALDLAR